MNKDNNVDSKTIQGHRIEIKNDIDIEVYRINSTTKEIEDIRIQKIGISYLRQGILLIDANRIVCSCTFLNFIDIIKNINEVESIAKISPNNTYRLNGPYKIKLEGIKTLQEYIKNKYPDILY